MARYYEESALIEFVKLYTPTIGGETAMECVERAIRSAHTADVAPKSEVVTEVIDRLAREGLLNVEPWAIDELKTKYTEGGE